MKLGHEQRDVRFRAGCRAPQCGSPRELAPARRPAAAADLPAHKSGGSRHRGTGLCDGAMHWLQRVRAGKLGQEDAASSGAGRSASADMR